MSLFGLSLLLADAGQASSLSISSTSLTVTYPDTVAMLAMQNDGKELAAGQIRVFRWLQEDGQEVLRPTRDVVVSPPALKLVPGRSMTIRVVRTAKQPVTTEECYRILIDQLPAGEQSGYALKFTIRQSVPLCYDSGKAHAPADIKWSIAKRDGVLTLLAANQSDHRVVAKNVRIVSKDGGAAEIGTVAVLGNSSMGWPVKAKLKHLVPGAKFKVTATVDDQTKSYTGSVDGAR